MARYTVNFDRPERLQDDDQTLALYHFDEGTGDRLLDSSGNHHHGKIVGATWVNPDGSPIAPAPRSANYALQFDGQTAHAILDNLKVDGSRPCTLEFWVRPAKENSKGALNHFTRRGKVRCA